MAWEVHHVTGTVNELHGRSADLVAGPPGQEAVRVVRVLHPVDRAVVLGSAQPEDCVDYDACADAGVEVVRRRSGGGAVLVRPGDQAWVDLLVPAGDPLWEADVSRASWWLGEAWARALVACGLGGVEVWKGPMQRSPWSSLICFAGRAAGEVTVPGGAKVVGLCQRRSRVGALVQCACILLWEPVALLDLLALAPQQRAEALDAVAGTASGAGAAGDALVAHLLAELP
jgi:lipoate-protein ligase A